MPKKKSTKKRKRDYRREYDTYQGTEEQKKNRAKRNKVRRKALREGKVVKGDDKEVDHIKPLSKGGSNSKSNTRITSRSANRRKFTSGVRKRKKKK